MKHPGYSKYKSVQTIVDGIRFPSKKEARYYSELLLRIKAGEVEYFLRQVPLHLPGGVTMRIDFLEFWTDGSVHYVDTKGYATRAWLDKKKIAEALYPICIETP